MGVLPFYVTFYVDGTNMLIIRGFEAVAMYGWWRC